MQETGSVLDIFKTAVGPSETFTQGAWHAAQRFVQSLEEKNEARFILGIKIILYGPVAANCKACRTDDAIILGLGGYSPVHVDPAKIGSKLAGIRKAGRLSLRGIFDIPFHPDTAMVCLEKEILPFHQNALTFLGEVIDGQIAETYYLTGQGTAEREGERAIKKSAPVLPYPVHDAAGLVSACEKTGKTVSELVFENEKAVMPVSMIRITAKNIGTAMQESIYRGCTAENSPAKWYLDGKEFSDHRTLVQIIRKGGNSFSHTLDWIGCFASAVEEESASMGRVVAAPTCETAGIAASVLQYCHVFYHSSSDTGIIRFLLTAGQVGRLFKVNGTTDYALATAMAAAGLAELLGGSARQVLTAAEIAVTQSRYPDTGAIGAVKAVMAAQAALQRKPLKIFM